MSERIDLCQLTKGLQGKPCPKEAKWFVVGRDGVALKTCSRHLATAYGTLPPIAGRLWFEPIGESR